MGRSARRRIGLGRGIGPAAWAWTTTTVFLLALYWWTLAPSIAELHDNLDSAELVTVASVSGVAHPPGSAIWLPLGRLALEALPFVEEPARRTNLLSVLCMAAAGGFLASATIRWRPGTPRWAGVFAGVLAGVAPITWAQGIVTEIFGLHAILGAMSLWLAPDALRGRRWPAFAFVLGMLCWNHPTGLALALPLGAVCLLRGRRSARTMATAALAFAIPAVFSVAYLWLRADAPIAWGDTGSAPGIWAHLSGQDYQGALDRSPTSIAAALPETLRRTFAQLPVPTWLFVVIGITALASVRPALSAAVGTTAVLLVLFVSAYRVTGRQDYLSTVTMIAAMAAAYGAIEAWAWLRPRLPARGPRLAAVAITWGLLGAWIALVGSDVSRRGDTEARDAAIALIRSQPADAVIETSDDEVLFGLWYAQVVLGERADITIQDVRDIAPVIGGSAD